MLNKKMFINGEWVDSLSGRTRKIINPYNSEGIAVVAEGNASDSKKAIAAARQAFDFGVWPTLTGSERGRFLSKIRDLILRDHEELAILESLDTGKTVEESRWDMDGIADVFKYYASLADENRGDIIDSPIPDTSSVVVREPVGVCGQISPWNYPLLQASWKMAPALAAGCTIVMKPSEITPLTTVKITELAEEAGFPPGVVNLVLGPGEGVGSELAESPDVDLISFTGGIETGKKIIQAASSNVKKIALELGGKNPNIVFSDADFDTALDFAMNAVFFHAGQICSAGARLMVEASIHDRFVSELQKRMEKIQLGNGFDANTQMGPLISEEHRSKIEDYVDLAKKEGATLVLGGRRPEAPELENGFFYLPTLFTGCTSQMRIIREESFGPVITVEKFEGEEEALRLANDTDHGLSAGFWTNDPARIERMSRKLRFGTVWVNDFNVYFAQAPWGGYKQSGMGRELGMTGLEEYCELKHVFQNFNTKPVNWFGN
ncbi:betaine-aldehyde dehydrogenase [Desulfoluna spongiiphila]|uniref:Betaine-aldehyde dehydrogenase n=1 Tax=Desulfoluna spongiiphila TaxID=419481 RepID=A0A1G5D625_9BACT|nr:betaine-aldehyde dehydrogenase [Desulfoluna spongiiphila]SCY10084.1 aldehyde dehydrogenase (acceptor) [Desulfoluna spongiiphila]